MRAVVNQCAVGVISVAVLLFAGCSSSSTPSTNPETAAVKKAEAPPETVAAKAAFWPLDTAARSFAPDVVFLRLSAKEVPGFKNEEGKAAEWEATFGSPSQHALRIDTYAITSVPPSLHKGVTAGLKSSWGGVTRDMMPIDPSTFNIDSDAAYKAAAADAADWLKKNPTKKLTSMDLGNIFKFHGPVWYIVWGDKKDGYASYVDANTGKVLKK